MTGKPQFLAAQSIYDCARVLLILSPAAVKSERVQGEWITALEEKKPIVPVIYQECRVPSRLRLLQRIDLIAKGLEDTINLNHLVVTLGEKRSVAPAPPTVPEVSLSPQQEEPRQSEVLQPPQESAPSATLAPSFRNRIGMEFVLIPAGEFQMGSNDGADDEKPVHRVRITRPFYLGKYPVTQTQWETVMGNNPSRFAGEPTRPVEKVSWDGTQEFLRRLGEKEKKYRYRLPTEAEWEYAARAGSTAKYCFGDDAEQLGQYAWYDKNARGTPHPVGKLKPNAWGVYDVHGNVWEWVNDWFDEAYYQKSPTDDPQGPADGQHRVLRGGSYLDDAWIARCAFRDGCDPYFVDDDYGFRVVVLPKL
jgi:formylglycine-generating enzyme required for sulfatase activity